MLFNVVGQTIKRFAVLLLYMTMLLAIKIAKAVLVAASVVSRGIFSGSAVVSSATAMSP